MIAGCAGGLAIFAEQRYMRTHSRNIRSLLADFPLSIIPLLLLSVVAASCTDGASDSRRESAAGVALQMPRKGDATLLSAKEDLARLVKIGEEQRSKYSVRDFFRNPDKTDFRLSPDGTWFSYLGPYENRMNIFVQKIGEGGAQRITSETERDISGYLWVSDGRLIYARDAAGEEDYRLYGIDVDGTDYTDLTPYDSVKIRMIDELRGNPDEVIIGMNKEKKALFEPYRLNVHTGEVERLARNDDARMPISEWLTDHDGRIRMAVQFVGGVDKRILYRDTEEEPFREIMSIGFDDSFTPLLFNFDNGPVIYAATNLGRDKEAIVEYDIRRKKEKRVVFAHMAVDVGKLNYSRKRKVITYASYTTDKTNRFFFDEETKALYQKLEEMLPGFEVYVASRNLDEDRFLVRTYNDRSLGAYYLYDTGREKLEHLVDVSPWIEASDMARMQPVSYKSRDSVTIYGYLTLPNLEPGRKASNLPVIINPHGGPWSRNKWGFNPEVQLLASRGYAVLQMNFRGSTGYGKEFWKASFKQWGRLMQDDITDGVHWLIEEGIADPDRIAIYGGSYGGYAALAGAAFTPDLYTCAVDYVGVSNLHTFLKTIPAYWKPYREMMYEMIGDPAEDSVLMAQASPVNFADNIKCPLFVAQGANDPRVNINESDQIVRAVRENGIDVSYMVKYDEGHGFRNEENRMEFYNAMMGFLDTHLKPKATSQRFP